LSSRECSITPGSQPLLEPHVIALQCLTCAIYPTSYIERLLFLFILNIIHTCLLFIITFILVGDYYKMFQKHKNINQSFVS